MDDITAKYEIFSREFNKAYKYYETKQSQALSEYYKHMYSSSTVYLDDYMRELQHQLAVFRRRIEELRSEYSELIRG